MLESGAPALILIYRGLSVFFCSTALLLWYPFATFVDVTLEEVNLTGLFIDAKLFSTAPDIIDAIEGKSAQLDSAESESNTIRCFIIAF